MATKNEDSNEMSRRKFFKTAAKRMLPILGILAFPPPYHHLQSLH